jgi:hypothetical protein
MIPKRLESIAFVTLTGTSPFEAAVKAIFMLIVDGSAERMSNPLSNGSSSRLTSNVLLRKRVIRG